MNSASGTLPRLLTYEKYATHPSSQRMQNNWHCRNLGSAFSWTSAVPLRVVKMQGHSFASRSVMNSRSFVHFHSAGEGIRPYFLCLSCSSSKYRRKEGAQYSPVRERNKIRGPRREISDFSVGYLFGVPVKRITSALRGHKLRVTSSQFNVSGFSRRWTSVFQTKKRRNFAD